MPYGQEDGHADVCIRVAAVFAAEPRTGVAAVQTRGQHEAWGAPTTATYNGRQHEFPVDPDTNRRRQETFGTLCRSYREFLDSLVTDRKSDLAEYVYSVKPHAQMPLVSAQRTQVQIYGSADDRRIRCTLAPECFLPSAVEDGQVVPNEELVARGGRGKTRVQYNMVDDDELIVLENGAKVFARELCDQQVVFCLSAGRNGKWVFDSGLGTPSAVTLVRNNDEVVFYCFSCTVMNVVLECDDQYGFVPNAEEVVQLGDVKLNWDGRQRSRTRVV
ncbi:hypothetical protein V1517DRAFT_374862 [Lipomyces orientalis]|uniref:Uncharacterized protein n=1 Tax=Lipomyces orientalis TaxID=1233043 RepID=A0ACC3TK87_9ASCO